MADLDPPVTRWDDRCCSESLRDDLWMTFYLGRMLCGRGFRVGLWSAAKTIATGKCKWHGKVIPA